ncbi:MULTISPECIES: branched-chain amino acid ABC transporter substrate-binding protein [unclassified Delftia]|uniref:branched-chain amino acid ABC transporter substrate-binding protein n=1 Tax=unclassified Delftia TaxID=2613839 RepID=UPI0018FFD613|nr:MULTISPECIES: branched-chain amino acid ABC transporter substrate-binding protein [unclassified Delftia]MBK0113725.1 branched-chain amino acid ABC transporter substrate-binding protein [Delftia sp. S65]MBK0119590.1 branched-chain amino acid ABC transporter substrate-binding protein [Delftia sp. S67]MBK0132993.1 branched-chain amino acid ABC transporter substrate-binding protein [Delftia sp. S66]
MNKLRRKVLKSGAMALFAAPALAALAANERGQPVPPPLGEPIRLALIESLSGPFANTGEAVFRNLLWATERVNARGGVPLPAAQGGARPLAIERHDSKGQNEEALSALRAAIDGGARVVMQGNSSAVAAVLVDAIAKHNERDPARRVLYLNYSAVDPALTNERCSFWHFRFDAHADMRMAALMQVLREDAAVRSAYLIGQDYSFGQAVLREARRQLAAQRPDVAIVGDELHPVGRVKDFAPYAAKIKASGAQAVITGNWGNDLMLLVKAAREAGFDGRFYTFYGNALGAPAALGEAGVGKVLAVADWLPNVPGPDSQAFYKSFRERFPRPADDYVHMRMQLMIEALAQSMARAGSTDTVAVAQALEGAEVVLAGRKGRMRAADHQFQQALVVGVMDRQGAPGVPFDVEGSGYGFRVVREIEAARAEQPAMCRMRRP